MLKHQVVILRCFHSNSSELIFPTSLEAEMCTYCRNLEKWDFGEKKKRKNRNILQFFCSASASSLNKLLDK